MNRLLLFIMLLLLVPSLVFADPFLACDSQLGVTHYQVIWLDTGAEEVSEAQMDGSAFHDLAEVPDGDNRGELRAGKEYTLDGVDQGVYEWYDPTPFLYGNPADTGPPTGLVLGE